MNLVLDIFESHINVFLEKRDITSGLQIRDGKQQTKYIGSLEVVEEQIRKNKIEFIDLTPFETLILKQACFFITQDRKVVKNRNKMFGARYASWKNGQSFRKMHAKLVFSKWKILCLHKTESGW